MSTTQNTYTGDGSTTNYSFTFEYLKQTDIKASLNNVATTEFTFVNATTLSFNTAPAAGTTIRIFRITDISTISATFFPGAAIRSKDLNDNFEQTLYVTQEYQENNFRPDGSIPMAGNLDLDGFDVINGGAQFNKIVDLNNNRITNLGAPAAATDAATRQYVEDTFTASGDTNKVSTVRTRTVATQGQTTVTVHPSFYIGNELVFINGAELSRNVDYTTPDDSSVVFAEPLLAGDVIDVLAFNNIIRVDTSADFDSVPFSRNAFIATAGQTVFTCSEYFTVLQEQVFMNGALLKRNVDYTTSGTTVVTLVVPALVDDLLEVHSGNYIATGVAPATTSPYTYPGGSAQTIQQRLEQYVSVKDFGAVGDGITDDTVAVKAAAANGIPAYFPAGSYKLTEPIQGDFFSTGGVTVSGGPVEIRTTAWGFISNPDTNDSSWQRKIGTPNQMYSDLYLGGNLSVGKLEAFELAIQPTNIQWDGTTLTFTLPDPGVPESGYDGKNVYITDSVSGFGNGYNTAAGTGRFTLTIEPGKDITPLLSIATTSLVFYRPADPVGSIIVSKDFEKISQFNIQPAYSIYIGRDATRPLDAPFLVSEFGTYRKNADAPDVGIIRSPRLTGFDGNRSTRFALSVDGDGGTYQQNKNEVDYAGSTNFVLNRYGTVINRDDSLQKDPDGMLYISCNNSTMTDAITITNFNSAGARINFLSSTNFVGGTSPNNSADDRQCSIESDGGAVGKLAFRTPKGGEGTNIRMQIDYRGLELFNSGDTEFKGLVMEDTAVPGDRYSIQITNGSLVATKI